MSEDDLVKLTKDTTGGGIDGSADFVGHAATAYKAFHSARNVNNFNDFCGHQKINVIIHVWKICSILVKFYFTVLETQEQRFRMNI